MQGENLSAPSFDGLRTRGVLSLAPDTDGPAWSMTAVGDTIPYNTLATKIAADGDATFGDVAQLLDAEIRYCNWEGAIGTDIPPTPPNSILIHCPPEIAETTVRNLRFNMFCLANNHTGDLGPDGVINTLTLLSAYGSTHGAGATLADAQAPAVVEPVPGVRVGFLGFGWTHDDDARVDRPGISPFRRKWILETISRTRSQVDVLVVSLHKGYEFAELPQPNFKETCRLCTDAGANIVLGHDPHVPQGIAIVDGSVVCYSLGNFFFDVEYHRTRIWSRTGPVFRFMFRGATLTGLQLDAARLTENNDLITLADADLQEVRAYIADLSIRAADDTQVTDLAKDLGTRLGYAIFRQIYRMGQREDRNAFDYWCETRSKNDAMLKIMRDYVCVNLPPDDTLDSM